MSDAISLEFIGASLHSIRAEQRTLRDEVVVFLAWRRPA
jgi:hypothetical protein